MREQTDDDDDEEIKRRYILTHVSSCKMVNFCI